MLITNSTELTSVANAIRAKTGSSSLITYPTGFVSAIGSIPSGGSKYSNTVTIRSSQPSSYVRNIELDFSNYLTNQTSFIVLFDASRTQSLVAENTSIIIFNSDGTYTAYGKPYESGYAYLTGVSYDSTTKKVTMTFSTNMYFRKNTTQETYTMLLY